MPIPKPSAGESQADYMGRCMGNQTMMTDYPRQAQRLAVCFGAWRDAHPGSAPPPSKEAPEIERWAAEQFSALLAHSMLPLAMPATMRPVADEKHGGFMARCMSATSVRTALPDPGQRAQACELAWTSERGSKGPPAVMRAPDATMMPHDGEDHSTFMDRCMADPAMADATPDERAAACHAQWMDASSGMSGGKQVKDVGVRDRMYAVLTVKALSDGDRIIEGIASTPATDWMGDIIEPLGAAYRLPIPLLWQHKTDQPVGHVEYAQPNAQGIPFRARIAKIEEPGQLKDRVDLAWQSLKANLVRGVSIGFAGVEIEPIQGKAAGYRFKKWQWHELSLVTIPANVEATITSIRSIDLAEREAASGHNPTSKITQRAGVAAPETRDTQVPEDMATISEQIASYEATRSANAARMDLMMREVSDKGITLDAEQEGEYDQLETDNESIVKHLARLHKLSKSQQTSLVVVDPAAASTEDGGSRVRGARTPAQVKGPELPKGTAFTRLVIALVRAKGNPMQAAEIASGMWHESTPAVDETLKMCGRFGTMDIGQLRAAMSAGTTTDTTWAAPLVNYQILTNEFIELLRPATIIGRVPGFRRVPFNVKMPSQTSGSTVNWVGEGKVKPVGALAFDSVTLGYTKLAGIVVLTQELIRFSNPAVEGIVRQDLINAVAEFMDRDFVDPTKALQTGVSPASVTNGATPVVATGTLEANFRADAKSVLNNMLNADMSPAGAVWIMTQQQALSLSLMINALDQPSFPTINMNGGTLLGLPVIASENIPGTGGSPTDGTPIILLKPSEVLMADDGNVTIDASNEASIQMDSAPDSPPSASTVLVSLWQHNMVALRAEREINWKLRNAAACQYISFAKYA